MSNNYQPGAGFPPAPLFITSDDLLLNQQQQTYYALSVQFVRSAQFVNRSGADITDKVQRALMNLQVPMTVQQAVTYFPGAYQGDNRWGLGIIDWYGTYQSQVANLNSIVAGLQ
jgi:hypothetical protein